MAYKFFMLTLLFGLSLSAAPITAERPSLRIQLHHSNKISNLSGNPLIESACRGVGGHESDCLATLHSAPPHQKADAHDLAFFALRFVEDHAVNLSVDLKKLAVDGDVAPLLQAALSDCLDQYNPLDDLIEDAINALLADAYTDVKQFINAAISDIDECDGEFKSLNLDDEAYKNTGEDLELVKNMKDYNLFLKNMLNAALNIVKSK